jgi:putative GTP pyrophosphokinase
MSEEAGSLSTAAVDQLGERLRKGITVDDLRALDQYRRAFRTDYDAVISAIRDVLTLEPSGRPAKSTSAIVDKLRRGSMRLSQMQDIAGCRLVVTDTLGQNEAVNRLVGMFPAAVVDRREKPSHGYRAVHVVVRLTRRPIEIQVRTVLQHLWAEFSEKAADAFGIEVKYGGGHKTVRCALDQASELVARFERLELNKDQIGDQLVELRSVIETNLLEFLAIVRK